MKMIVTFLISSKSWISGDKPPCTHRNCWFINAANGKQSNASIHAMYTRSEYFIRPKKQRCKSYFIHCLWIFFNSISRMFPFWTLTWKSILQQTKGKNWKIFLFYVLCFMNFMFFLFNFPSFSSTPQHTDAEFPVGISFLLPIING